MNRIPRTIGWQSAATMAVLAVFFMGAASPASGADPAVPADETSIDASRGSFARFLDSHPELADDVQSNPMVVADPGYRNEHPELVAFLDAHPLVKADPRAFVTSRRSRYSPSMMDELSPLVGSLAVMFALLWVIRSLLENRRWSKSAAVQAEIHTKLLDRFGSSQEMLAYMQTDAGKRFLESGTLTLESDQGRKTPQVIGRILWSVQSGVVLFLVGVGLIWVRDSVPQGAQPLLVLGTLALALGAGFVLSAVVSYVMTKRLGLLPGAPAPSQLG